MNNGGGGVAALTELLGDLKDAQDARTDFLEEAGSNSLLAKNQVFGDEKVEEIASAIETEYSDASGDLDDALGVSDFGDRSVTFQNTAIAEGVAAAQKEVSDFEKEIAKVEGLGLAIRNFNNATANKKAAENAETVAEIESDAQVESFEARANKLTAVEFFGAEAELTDDFDFTDVVEVKATHADDDEVTLMTVSSSGQFEVAAAYADVAGIAALRDAFQAYYDAVVEADKAETRLSNAEEALGAITDFSDSDVLSADDLNSGQTIAAELKDLQDAVTTLEELVARFENARDLNTELESLDEAVADARTAIEDEDDGLGVSLLPADTYVAGADVTATESDDVILFSKDLDGADILDFGDSGEDRIFFGDGYSLVQLDGAWDASNATGDASALEIFWSQSGGNLTLYVETEAFGGSASGVSDIAEIQLTGVTAADIEFSGGYLTAGEPA